MSADEMKVLEAYQSKYNHLPSAPLHLINFSKSSPDLPNLNYMKAKRVLAAAKNQKNTKKEEPKSVQTKQDKPKPSTHTKKDEPKQNKILNPKHPIATKQNTNTKNIITENKEDNTVKSKPNINSSINTKTKILDVENNDTTTHSNNKAPKLNINKDNKASNKNKNNDMKYKHKSTDVSTNTKTNIDTENKEDNIIDIKSKQTTVPIHNQANINVSTNTKTETLDIGNKTEMIPNINAIDNNNITETENNNIISNTDNKPNINVHTNTKTVLDVDASDNDNITETVNNEIKKKEAVIENNNKISNSNTDNKPNINVHTNTKTDVEKKTGMVPDFDASDNDNITETVNNIIKKKDETVIENNNKISNTDNEPNINVYTDTEIMDKTETNIEIKPIIINIGVTNNVEKSEKYYVESPVADILEKYWELYTVPSIDVSNETVMVQNALTPLTPQTPISSKFKQVMDGLQIKNEARNAMNEWNKEKKIQMILQYDFMEKSQQLKVKKVPKRRKSFIEKLRRKKNKNDKSGKDSENNQVDEKNDQHILSEEEAISVKFEEILNSAQVPNHARSIMREWSDDMKYQMILQHQQLSDKKKQST